jgi:citrate lyase subunit beta/citryl-CoA lyase
MPYPIAHSYLFVPGNRPERFSRAAGAGAHAVIVDLEDAVPPADKVAARESLAGWLSPDRRVMVRINARNTEWYQEDIALCRHPGVAGVVLPKAEDIGPELLALCAGSDRTILPLVETAGGFDRARALASAPAAPHVVDGVALGAQPQGVLHEGLLEGRFGDDHEELSRVGFHGQPAMATAIRW